MSSPYTSRTRFQYTESFKMFGRQCSDIGLTSLQGNQSTVAGVGDGDNSLSMRRVKSGAYGCRIHAAGAGGGWHRTAVGNVAGVEKDRQPNIGSSKAIAQAILITLGIAQRSVMGLFTRREPLLQRQAFILLGLLRGGGGQSELILRFGV